MEIVPNIYQLKVPIPDNPLENLNAYVVKTPAGSMLIDTGWNSDDAYNALIRQLGELGVGLGDLKYIVITHRHPDHYGLIGRLTPQTDARVVLHEADAWRLSRAELDALETFDPSEEWLRVNGMPYQGAARSFRAMFAAGLLATTDGAEWRVRGGEHIRLDDFDFEIVWTPGHSPGHICLYEANLGVFFSGDHVLPVITPHVSLMREAMGNPLEDYLNSLRRVEGYPVRIVLPAHENIFHNLAGRTAGIRAHHDERNDHILSSIGGEQKTAYQIAGTIPWETLGVAWQDLDPIMKHAAVAETLAHLELLRSEGRLSRTRREDLYWYAKT